MSQPIQPPPALVVPMRRNLLMVLAFLVAAPVLGGLVGLLVGPAAGWSVLLGVLIPTVFFGITVAIALATAGVSVEKLGATVLGSWLAKIVLLLIALNWLKDQAFFNRAWFLAVFLIATTLVLVLEAYLVKSARTPYVDL